MDSRLRGNDDDKFGPLMTDLARATSLLTIDVDAVVDVVVIVAGGGRKDSQSWPICFDSRLDC